MTEDEWDASDAGQAFLSFEAFVLSIGLMTVGGAVGGGVLNLLAIAAQRADKLTPRLARQFDPKRNEAIPAALAVIATWSAFEAWVQDFVKILMRSDPYILENRAVQERKYSMSDLLAPEADRLDVVYRALYASLGRKRGVDRYEDLFKVVGLSAAVPPLIKDTFYAAQSVRHVWVHRAGVADAEFVRQAPHLGYLEGELVAIPYKEMSEYMSAVITYAFIVANRHRAIHGLGPIPMEGQPGETAIGQAYRGLYSQ